MTATATRRSPLAWRPARPVELVVLVVGVAALAILVGTTLSAAFDLAGPAVALLPVAAVLCWFLVLHPGWALGALVGSALVFEPGDDALWGLSADRWYDYLPGTPFLTFDVLLGCLVLGLVLQLTGPDAAVARSRVRLPGTFTLPLLLMAAATAFGLANGVLGGGLVPVLVTTGSTLGYLIVLPVLVLWVVRDEAERARAIGVAAALIVAKAVYAVSAYAAGEALPFEGSGLTYYEPAMNHASVLYLIAVVAAPFAKLRLPTWVLVGWPIVLLSLLLSFRRAFWISAVLALVLALIVGSGQRGRPWLFFGAALAGAALWFTLSSGGATAGDNPLLGRAQSISPTEVQQSSNDRYRLEEQANVIDELSRHPLTGVGVGIPWTARHPLSLYHEGGRHYSHVTPLWYWLKLGPLGVLAYGWLVGAVVFVGVRLWRRARPALDRVLGLTMAAATAGLVVGETTGGFTGINLRITIVVAFGIGLLASAQADERAQPELADGRAQDLVALPGVPPPGS